MSHLLDMGQPLELPEPEDGDPLNALENWCAGFVDALENEDDWLEENEGNSRPMGHAGTVRTV